MPVKACPSTKTKGLQLQSWSANDLQLFNGLHPQYCNLSQLLAMPVILQHHLFDFDVDTKLSGINCDFIPV